MTGITTIDHVMLLLREQLRQSERVRADPSLRTTSRAATPQQRIAALAAIDDLPPRDFRRALVRSLLSERLGEALVSDPAFDAVTGEVLRIIEDSDEARALLDQVVERCRAGE